MAIEIKHRPTYKNVFHNYWSAETIVKFENNREMRISTHKTSSGQIVSSANVGINENGGWLWAPFSDFGKRLLVTKGKATEKYVTNQHNEAIKDLDTLIAQARAFYKSE